MSPRRSLSRKIASSKLIEIEALRHQNDQCHTTAEINRDDATADRT